MAYFEENKETFQKAMKTTHKQIKETALIMLEKESFESVIDWVISQYKKEIQELEKRSMNREEARKIFMAGAAWEQNATDQNFNDLWNQISK